MSEQLNRSGRGVYVQGNDIDTDRIIPARFLKCVTFDELGPALFYDERFDSDDLPKGHILDNPAHRGASVLVTDANFGCGSSREHAPQALQKFGIEVIIAESFAEIFHGNCTTLGMPCLVMPAEQRRALAGLVQQNPDAEFLIDIEQCTLIFANQSFAFGMKESAREAFLTGRFDPLNELLLGQEAIRSVAEKLGYAETV
ncbi:MAG: 3-isopropylmalate dehydratase small subunit [Pseudomonadales bacterium]